MRISILVSFALWMSDGFSPREVRSYGEHVQSSEYLSCGQSYGSVCLARSCLDVEYGYFEPDLRDYPPCPPISMLPGKQSFLLHRPFGTLRNVEMGGWGGQVHHDTSSVLFVLAPAFAVQDVACFHCLVCSSHRVSISAPCAMMNKASLRVGYLHPMPFGYHLEAILNPC